MILCFLMVLMVMLVFLILIRVLMMVWFWCWLVKLRVIVVLSGVVFVGSVVELVRKVCVYLVFDLGKSCLLRLF